MDRDSIVDQVNRYEWLMGQEARERQEALARETCPGCWEPNEKEHHPLCRKRPPDEEPVEIDGQLTLA